jgi:hypothetical protein
MVKETLQPNLEAKANNSIELLSDTIGSDLISSLNKFFKDINFIFFMNLNRFSFHPLRGILNEISRLYFRCSTKVGRQVRRLLLPYLIINQFPFGDRAIKR